MIAYVDKGPKIEEQNGHFLVTFASGADKVQLLLTRSVCFELGRRAITLSCSAFENDAEIIQLSRADG
jgi:hypothetical protein